MGHDGGGIMHVHRVGGGLVVGRGEHARGRQEGETAGRGQACLLGSGDGGLALLSIRVSARLRVLALVVLVRLSVLVCGEQGGKIKVNNWC
jgi:hypothetical protein